MSVLPSKEELLNEIKAKINADYNAMVSKLKKRAEEVKSKSKAEVDKALSQVKFGP